MDLTDGVFWVASPPHQLGKFVAFDVNDFDRELPALAVTDDPLLASGEFDKAKLAQQALTDGTRALKNNDAQTALANAEKAETANPGFYQNAALRGRALAKLGRPTEAATAFETALARQPAFLSEKQELENLLKQAREGK